MMNKLLLIVCVAVIGCRATKPITYPKQPALYPVKYDTLWGYADFYGNTIIPPQFEEASLFYNGSARVKMEGKYGFILPNGKWFAKPKYDSAKRLLQIVTTKKRSNEPKQLSRAIVTKGTKKYYLNQKGKQKKITKLGPHEYGSCLVDISRIDDFTIKNEDGSYEIICKYYLAKGDSLVSEIIDTTDLKLDTIIELNQHYALLKKDGKYARHFIENYLGYKGLYQRNIVAEDSTYTFPVEFLYDDVKLTIDFPHSTAKSYKKDGKWGVIIYYGNIYVPFKYLSAVRSMEYAVPQRLMYLVEFEDRKYGWVSVLFDEFDRTKHIVREHFKRSK